MNVRVCIPPVIMEEYNINQFCIGCETIHHNSIVMVEIEMQLIDGSILDFKLCERCYATMKAPQECVAILVKGYEA